ncbi:DUF502 domain-containing protein [Pikeienuella piscinae]|uniref:DUF502 domain-containing protein n=1 Tax=Pikeienuella piscinae TaxID=2748098 RepID=A0A7L5BTI1_9RHOB|nr:DUF502 domain-containing protein [Pikeienuella piscinae]QIE54732.1 DUF502 domain-containing protein [Pikeienuella piscinae]
MKPFFALIKGLFIGGLLFLLPIGIVVVVFEKLLRISRKVGEALHSMLLPGVESNVAILLIAILVLVSIALAAGIFASTAPGKRTFVALERAVLERLPVYTVIRQMVADMSGNLDRVDADDALKVVEVSYIDHQRVGFLVGHTPDGRAIVYLPGAPSALKGDVVIVDADKVADTEMKAATVMAAMGRLGTGLLDKTAA